MADYILDKSDVGKVAQTVKEFGFCIIRNYFSKENCDLLKKEFDSIYEYVPDGSTGYCDFDDQRRRASGVPPNVYFSAFKCLGLTSVFYLTILSR